MDFSVIRSTQGLVPPSDPTPSGTMDLSVIDRLAVLRCNARTLHVFKQGPRAGAAQVLRKALSKALVPYYPLAGRLKYSSQGQLEIACSGDGVWLVEASANCTLDAVNYFDDVMSIPHDMLLPHHPPETEAIDPLVLIQVTQFACDGFVIGLVFCHSICDGLGAAQFLNAVGELARGLDLQHLSVSPVWFRDFLPAPPPQEEACAIAPPPPALPDYQLEHANIDIPLHYINQLKQEFRDNSMGQTCSAFEVVAASLWSRRTRAIKMDPNTEVKLVFFANCRQLLHPPLPKGFYGNCFFPVTIAASSETVALGSNSDVVKLIQEAKATLPNEFAKWIKGELGVDPFAPPLLYTTLFISEWGRLGFNQIDYGWGTTSPCSSNTRLQHHTCWHCGVTAIANERYSFDDMVRPEGPSPSLS
ncbi:hypothetical protein F0562_000701 [Nyssa sinensis]|uniref:Uncharacterized protein n=1 Tax=Nyssa sinensis TaxID=561372 RepID=A0A5J5C532_9ASTE|nr:hypothetical protein F0562_000701 [Nyssa sinensis]